MSESYASRRAWRVALIVLPFILLIPFGFVTTGGGGASTIMQSGSVACTVPSGQTSCTTVSIPFSPAYTKNPLVSFTGVSYNTAPGHTLTTTATTNLNNGASFLNLQNSTQLLYDTETSVSITVPNVDTSLSTFSPAYWGTLSTWNTLPQITMQADGYVQTTATSVLQDISVNIEDSGCPGTVLDTQIVHPANALASKKPWSLSAIETLPIFSSNVAVCTLAPAADANTHVFLVDFHVYLIQNHFQVWTAMPSATTELFGNSNHEQAAYFDPSAISGTIRLCVFVYGVSSGISPVLQAQYGTTNLGPAVSLINPGQICSFSSQTLPTGLQTLRIVGSGGAGASDIPAFGAISLAWTYQVSQTLSFTVFDPGNPSINTETATAMTLKYTFVGTISNGGGVIVTLTWQTIGS